MSGRRGSRLVSSAFLLLLVMSLLMIGASSAFAASKTRFEQTHPSVTYTPTWNNWADPVLSGGSYTWTNAGGTATFTFTGTRVDWIGLKYIYGGFGEVSLDGGPWIQASCYAAATQYQQVIWSATGLANTSHTLIIRWTGIHPLGPQPVYGGGVPPFNPAAIVNVDAFDVYPGLTVTASAGAGGSVSPPGATSVPWGASQSYAITPAGGNAVLDVVVDGDSKGPVTTWNFTNVTEDHSISATFRNVTASPASSGWSVTLAVLVGLGLASALIMKRRAE